MPRRTSRFGYFDPETKKFIPDDEVEDLVDKLREQGLPSHKWIRPGVDARGIQNAISAHSIIDQRDGMRYRMATGFDEWYAYLDYLKKVQESRKTEKQRLQKRIDDLSLIVNARRAEENARHLQLARHHMWLDDERRRLAEEARQAQERVQRRLERERQRAAEQLRRQQEKEEKVRQLAEDRDYRIIQRNFTKPSPRGKGSDADWGKGSGRTRRERRR